MIISIVLILTISAVYWQVKNHKFVTFDDDAYVTENPNVQNCLTVEGIIWAFTTKYHLHWHPLTWISHMIDCHLFGLNPDMHHLTNVFLHIANTLLLFFVLYRTTGALFQSAFVAALFALHPLHVESVAWIADRKDVLSTFFWMLTLWTYFYYSKRPGPFTYLMVLLFFTLGLMAKPMIVTLPFVLLLMDYWPLKRYGIRQSGAKLNPHNHKFMKSRYQRTRALQLIVEKVGLFIIAGISVIVTFSAMLPEKLATVSTSKSLAIKSNHIAEAMVSYVHYIGKMIWPFNLSVIYQKPDILPVWQVGGAGLLLLCISILVFWKGRRCPYLPVGWLWYLITLVPVIGVVNVGPQKIADRYTYVPLIGLFIMIVWAVHDIIKRWKYKRIALSVLTGIILITSTITSWLQTHYWKDSGTLFEHSLTVTPGTYIAHSHLGNFKVQQGKYEEAVIHYREALRLKSNVPLVYNNLGIAYGKLGKIEKAVTYFNKALRFNPDYDLAHNNLANALVKQNKIEEASVHFREVL